MCQECGQILRLTSCRLDVFRDRRVALAAEGAGKRRVRNVSNEHVLEQVLDVAADPARWHPTDEVPHLQRSQSLVQLSLAAKRGKYAAPKGRADDGCVQEYRAGGGWQSIKASRDRCSDCGRKVGTELVPLGERRRQLLDEKRISFGGLGQSLDRPFEAGRFQNESLREGERLGAGQRLESNRGVSEQTTAPGWSAVDELRPGQPDDHQRHILYMRCEVLDEIQKGGVGPVQVLEDDKQRLDRSKTLEQPPGCKEQVIPITGRFVDTDAGEQRDVAGRLFDFRRRQQPLDGRVELRPDRARRIVLVDFRDASHQLRERAVCRTLAIRQAPPARYRGPVFLDAARELALEP